VNGVDSSQKRCHAHESERHRRQEALEIALIGGVGENRLGRFLRWTNVNNAAGWWWT